MLADDPVYEQVMGGGGDEGRVSVGLADCCLPVKLWRPRELEGRRYYAGVHRTPAFFWKERFSVNGGI